MSVETNIGRVIGGVPVENVIEESKRSRKRVVKEGFMEPEIYYGTAYEDEIADMLLSLSESKKSKRK